MTVFVEDLDHSGEIDTLISIEKIKASDVTDTVEIAKLTEDRLAGSDNLGGISEIDLDGNPNGDDKGDHIDLTDMLEAIKVDLSTGRVELKSDSTIGLKIINAERVTGGKGDDESIAGSAKNQLKGNEGNDLLSATSEASEIRVEGGKGNDVIDLRNIDADDSIVVFNKSDGRDTISYDPSSLTLDGIESIKIDFDIDEVEFVVEIENYDIQEGGGWNSLVPHRSRPARHKFKNIDRLALRRDGLSFERKYRESSTLPECGRVWRHAERSLLHIQIYDNTRI